MKPVLKLLCVQPPPSPTTSGGSLTTFASNGKTLLVEATDDFSSYVVTQLLNGDPDPRRGKVVIPSSNVRGALLAPENKDWDPAAPRLPSKK
jgi:hypothetical protein